MVFWRSIDVLAMLSYHSPARPHLPPCPPRQVADFLAAKLVQWDNRALWLELLYRHPQPGHPFAMQLPLRALVPPQGLPAGATIVDMLMATAGLSDPRLQVRGAAGWKQSSSCAALAASMPACALPQMVLLQPCAAMLRPAAGPASPQAMPHAISLPCLMLYPCRASCYIPAVAHAAATQLALPCSSSAAGIWNPHLLPTPLLTDMYTAALPQPLASLPVPVPDPQLLLPATQLEVVATALLEAVCTTVERVLLDGGPARYFSEQFTEQLNEDLTMLHACFVNEGQGVRADVVGKKMVTLRNVGGSWLHACTRLAAHVAVAAGFADADMVGHPAAAAAMTQWRS